jgi:hypothetical protein
MKTGEEVRIPMAPSGEAIYEIEKNLLKDEKILWYDKPKTGIIFRTNDIFLIPFSLLWTGFAFFWEFSVLTTDAPLLFKLWGLPFILAGLYITIGRFYFDSKRRYNTIYVLTNKRVIIRGGTFINSLNSLDLKSISNINLIEKNNNVGSIIFGYDSFYSLFYDGMNWPGIKMTPRFEMINNVKNVYNQIINIKNQ